MFFLDKKGLQWMIMKKKISSQVLTDTLTKTSQNIFTYSFISHSKHFILRMGGLTCSLREDAHKKF